jgi:hypothetical protein
MSTKTKKRNKLRLWSKRKQKLPVPKTKGSENKQGRFALRALGECDSRLAVVKELKRRLNRLESDAGVDCSQKEMLAGRAIFMVSFLESTEVSAMEGKHVDWDEYVKVLNCLTSVLGKLGVERQITKAAATLEEYIN